MERLSLGRLFMEEDGYSSELTREWHIQIISSNQKIFIPRIWSLYPKGSNVGTIDRENLPMATQIRIHKKKLKFLLYVQSTMTTLCEDKQKPFVIILGGLYNCITASNHKKMLQ